MKKSDFSYVFTRDLTGIGGIANRRKGGDYSHRNATFSYTSLRCGINIHILNCGRVLVLFNPFFRQKKPKLCCELGIQLLMTEQSDVYEKVAFRCEESPPFLRFAIRPIPVVSRVKTYDKSLFFIRFRRRPDGYWSYRKSEKRR